jgi:hypothetical protein
MQTRELPEPTPDAKQSPETSSAWQARRKRKAQGWLTASWRFPVSVQPRAAFRRSPLGSRGGLRPRHCSRRSSRWGPSGRTPSTLAPSHRGSLTLACWRVIKLDIPANHQPVVRITCTYKKLQILFQFISAGSQCCTSMIQTPPRSPAKRRVCLLNDLSVCLSERGFNVQARTTPNMQSQSLQIWGFDPSRLAFTRSEFAPYGIQRELHNFLDPGFFVVQVLRRGPHKFLPGSVPADLPVLNRSESAQECPLLLPRQVTSCSGTYQRVL